MLPQPVDVDISVAVTNIEQLEQIMFDYKAFVDMVLPNQDKEILSALVAEQQRSASNTEGPHGLIILLHGAPGVGKTATVRALAESLQVPILVISPGSLRANIGETYKEMNKFFRYAQRWSAIILLDDADVFLEQRSLSAIQRNTVVSVFLNSLEQYDGTLFLTTNRVGTFDEAVKSRIRLSIHFRRAEPEG